MSDAALLGKDAKEKQEKPPPPPLNVEQIAFAKELVEELHPLAKTKLVVAFPILGKLLCRTQEQANKEKLHEGIG